MLFKKSVEAGLDGIVEKCMSYDIAIENHARVKLGIAECLLLGIDVDERNQGNRAEQVDGQQGDVADGGELPALFPV